MNVTFNYKGNIIETWENAMYVPRIGDNVILGDETVQYDIINVIWYCKTWAEIIIDNWEMI